MTTAASLVEGQLRARWPSLSFQCCNCRPIAGSIVHSQHSWPGGNARDIFGPGGTLTTATAYLRANRARFGLKTILWQVPAHYDHIHFDPWPTGYSIPPCKGGAERYRYSDGRIVYARAGAVRPEGWGLTSSPPPLEESLTITDARLQVATAWYAVAGEWMTPTATEGRSARLGRLAIDVQLGRRTVASIVEYAQFVRTPEPDEWIPAWVFTPGLWVN